MNISQSLYNSWMWINNPDIPKPELPVVWGILPESLHRYDSNAVLILQWVLSHHPQHYESFVAILASNSVWGKRIVHLLKDIFLDGSFYNPHDFFQILIPDALRERIDEFSLDEDWKNEWNSFMS